LAKPPLTPALRPEDDPFIREVDEEYRREEMQKFATSWGRWILVAVGLGLAAFGGYLFWQSRIGKAQEAATETLMTAVNATGTGDLEAAQKALPGVVADGSPAQQALARLAEAGIAANGGQPDKAIAALNLVAGDAKAPEPLRDLARIRLLHLEFDKLKPQEVLARARPWIEGDSPWFPAVAELAAVAHLKAGQRKEAGALYLRLAGTIDAPETQRARAEQMAAYLGEDTTVLVEKLRAGAAARGAG
jgi:hypothetical protein